jgi:hypothetical protein
MLACSSKYLILTTNNTLIIGLFLLLYEGISISQVLPIFKSIEKNSSELIPSVLYS